jgi:hypothetical protein
MGRVRADFAVLLLVLLVACRDIVGFEEAPESGIDLPMQSEPILPFVPADDLRSGCEACARESCGELRETCLGDDVCRDLLQCRSRCGDPVCFARCGSFATFHGNLQVTGYPVGAESPLYASYDDCVASTNCREACGIGLNWECLGNESYRWPKRSAVPIPVQMSIFNEHTGAATPAGVEASDDADRLLDRGDTGEWGQVELDLRMGNTFAGYFTIVPKLQTLRSVLYYPGTLFRPTRGVVGVIMPFERNVESPLTAAMFSIRDCLGYFASGVSFEIDGVVPLAQWSVTSGLSGANNEPTSEVGTTVLDGVAPQPDTVVVRAVRRDRMVARRVIYLRKGVMTRADLWPLSGDE